MVLNIKGGDCDDPVRPTKCSVPAAETFTLSVDALTIPNGYALMQTYVDYGGTLIYKQQAIEDEIIWPDLDDRTAVRSQRQAGHVNHGGLTGIASAPASFYTGTLVEIWLSCPSASTSQTTIDLLPYDDPIALTFGSGFASEPGVVVIPKVGSLTINCVTPPPTGTPTPIPTPGPAPQMALNIKGGDCDDTVQPTACYVEIGATFTLSVSALGVPDAGYFLMQTYPGSDPGLNMTAAWALGSARGAGIKIADCEYGYVAGHEDLCNITMEPGQTIHPNVITFGWDEHGTAVFGEMISVDNLYGCTGLVPDAQGYFFTEWSVEEGLRRVTAIANAIASVDPGDVVVLEMQTTGPGGGFGPAELDPAVWTLVRNATDAGIVVVAAAGNGNQNLDSAVYAEYRGRGDSGAIIVGAGSSDLNHDKLSFSTYGSRVNVQGWGQNVFTLGYGSFAQHGGDKNQRYTSGFNGTSSATPFVASCAVALQSLAEQRLGRRLTPLELRDMLVRTGIPQGSGGHVGPFPDMVAAAAEIVTRGDLNCDGVFNGADIDPFFLALGNPAAYTAQFPDCDIMLGDMTGDNEVDADDIDPFFECLGGGQCP